MKRILLIAVAVLVLAAGAAGAWWHFVDNHDPLAAARRFIKAGDSRAAMIELRRAVQANPASAEAHLRLAGLQLQSGDPVAAEKELKAARDHGAKAPELPLLLAQSYLQQGRQKDLLAEFQPPLATADLTSQLLILRSVAQMSLGDSQAAQLSLATAERDAPDAAGPPLAEARMAVARGDLVFAQLKISQALAHDPRRPDALLLKAQVLNAQGDSTGALDALGGALALAPHFSAALLERANLLITLNQDARAKTDVDLALGDQPNAVGGIYLRAVLQARAGDDANADLNFQRLSGMLQRFPRAYYFQAIVKYHLGQMEQATEAAHNYLQINPRDPAGVKLLARIELAAGRADPALATLQAAAKSGTADAEMLDLLGRAYAVTGKPAQAIQSFDKAVAAAPGNAEILTHLASAQGGRMDAVGAGGAADIARSLQTAPDRADPVQARLVAALTAGDADAAARALAELRKRTGNTEATALLAGAVMVMQQDIAGASALFEKLIADNPHQIQARVALAQLRMLQGRPEDAEHTLAAALTQNPADPQALGAMVNVLLREAKIGGAVAVMEAAVAAAPANPAFTLALSDLYIRAGTADRSITLLDHPKDSAELGASAGSPPFMAARARALIALHKPAAARGIYEALLAHQPGDEGLLFQVVALQSDAHDWDAARATIRAGLAVRQGDPVLLRLLVGVAFNAAATGPAGAVAATGPTGAAAGDKAAAAEIARLQADPQTRDGAATLAADFDMFRQRYHEAGEAYAALLKATPSVPLMLSAANAYGAAGMIPSATAVLRDWLAAHPDDVDAGRMLAAIEIPAGHLDVARGLLEKVLQMAPSDPMSLNNLAWIYQQQNDPRALALARRAFLLSPSPQSADTLGWVLASQNDAAGGLPLLRQAAAALPGDPDIQFHYAAALQGTGSSDAARAILQPLAARPVAFASQAAARKLLGEMPVAK